MPKLSKELAEWHYKKLSALHYFDYLTLAQKVGVFYHDLEHEILKEITGKKEYFEQFNWLKDNQIRFERNVKTGNISKVDISDIDNLKNWRNEGMHENKMPEPKYKSHFLTMARIICFFSEIPIPDEVNNILNNRQNENSPKKRNSKKSNTAKLGKNGSIKIINRKLSLNIRNDNTNYSSINENVPQWSFNLDNKKFNDDLNFIFEDQNNKVLFYFFIKSGTVKEPEKIFNQRNDKYVENSSIIIVAANDKNFTNNFNNREFQFIKYLKAEIKY